MAYEQQYGVKPVRNAKVNGQLTAFLKRIPAADAPALAAFYVRHKGQFYVLKRHPVGLLLHDAEGLHTQWKSKHSVTHTQAKQIDKTSTMLNIMQEVKDELFGKEAAYEHGNSGHADVSPGVNGHDLIEVHGKVLDS